MVIAGHTGTHPLCSFSVSGKPGWQYIQWWTNPLMKINHTLTHMCPHTSPPGVSALYTALLIPSSFLALALRKCRTLGSESSLQSLSQISFSCSQSIYFPLNDFFCLSSLETHLLAVGIKHLLDSVINVGIRTCQEFRWGVILFAWGVGRCQGVRWEAILFL